MRPKKAKDLIDLVAVKTNERYELVDDLVYHFYSVLRRKLSLMEENNIQVRMLGVFKISDIKLLKLIEKNESILKGDICEKMRNEVSEKLIFDKRKYEEIIKIKEQRDKFYEERNNAKKNMARKKKNL